MWHEIIYVRRYFFGKFYKIKCKDGWVFDMVPKRSVYGIPAVGAWVRVTHNMFLGARYQIER
jgi:hypothetical protein